MHERISCVIFDMDGTLTRTNELIFASFNHIARKYLDTTFTPREIVKFFGPPEEGALRQILGEELVPAAMEDLCAFYEMHHDAMASLHAGVREVLAFLGGHGVKQAVFTGKGSRTTAITLDALKIAQFFDLVVSGNDVVNHKPHPEGIARVLTTLEIEPGEALMVGDGMSDVTSSRAAGVRIAAALWDCYDRERVLASGADFVFDTVQDMHEWFRQHIN